MNQTPAAKGHDQTYAAAGPYTTLWSDFSSDVSSSDLDIVSFDAKNQTSNGGHLYHNGVLWADGQLTPDQPISTIGQWTFRSEERRVGKEGRYLSERHDA